MPRLLVVNHVVLLLGCSIYLGTAFFLVLFELPLEPKLTVDNYYLIFVQPIATATTFFTWVTIVMLICGTIMLVTEWFSGLRWVPIIVLVCCITAGLLTTQGIFPLNRELAAHITDPERLKVVFHQWANLSRLRASLWVIEWAAMAYWFYRMALQARGDR